MSSNAPTELRRSTPSFRGGQSKYARVREALRNQYESAPIGTLLPSEAALCELHQVSRITVRRAIDGLVTEGVLARHQGRGTFVAGTAVHERSQLEVFDLRGFHAQRTDEGRRVTSQVIVQDVFLAPEEVALALGIPLRSRVVRLDRLRSVDGTVDHLTRAWLPAEKYHDVVQQDFTGQSLYAYLTGAHGLNLTRVDVTVSIRRPTGDEARLLDAPLDSSRLVTYSTAFDDRGEPQVRGRTLYADELAIARFTVVAPSGSTRGESHAHQPAHE